MKTSLLNISKILLFLLIVSINLREPYIHSREILYFLFICVSFPYGNYNKLSNVLLLLLLWGISLLYNIIIPGSDAKQGTWYEGLLTSAYLLLLVFSNKRYYQTIISAFMFSAKLISIVTIVLWVVCNTFPSIRAALIAYFDNLYSIKKLTFVDIGNRMILGVDFSFVWYRTSPIVVPMLGYCCIKRLKGEKTSKNLITIILFATALVLSGTRANMLSSVLLVATYMVTNWYKKKHYMFACIVVGVVVYAAVIFATSFLNDKGSRSSAIKHLDHISYFNTFKSDYTRTFFFGWGTGSTFYSLGRRGYVDVTELSHLETVRRYGLIPFFIIMIFIWLKPLIKKLPREKGIIKYYYVAVVLAYIFVACTNPYLLDSVGMGVLLFFDAFFEYENIHRNDDLQRGTLPLQTA